MFPFFKSKKSSKRIAIISPLPHGAVIDVNNAFQKTLQESHDFYISFYRYTLYGTIDHMLLRAEEIARSDFDLIFSFGTSCTTLIQRALAAKNKTIPIVFCGISHPDKKGLVSSLENSYNNLTGMSSRHSSYASHVSIFLHVKPHTKNILILHNSLEEFQQEDAQKVKHIFSQYGLKAEAISANHPRDIEKTITPFTQDFDTIFALRDNVILSGMNEIIRIGNREGITIFNSECYSPKLGSAAGYGAPEIITGTQSAEKAISILAGNKEPHEIPITEPDHILKLFVNRKTMLQQGLVFLGTKGE